MEKTSNICGAANGTISGTSVIKYLSHLDHVSHLSGFLAADQLTEHFIQHTPLAGELS